MADWRTRLRAVVARWDLSPEEQSGIVDELEQHLEEQLAELRVRVGDAAALDRIMAQVDDPALRDASVRARHRPTASVQSSRVRAAGWSVVIRDFRYGWRSLIASPGTTAMATIALALGIGLTTVMFSVIYGLLLRGLPYEHGDRIAVIMKSAAVDGMDEALSMHEFFAYRDEQRSFDDFGAFVGGSVNISGNERPDRIDAARVTAAALAVTRVHPMLGRSLRAEDEGVGGALVVVLSHSLWRDRYAGDSTIVGRPVRINGQPATVVGVMPDGFGFPNSARLWLPLRLNPAAVPWGTGTQLSGVGRLRAGMTFGQANAEMAGIAARIDAEHGQAKRAARFMVQPFIRASIRSQVYSLLYAMFVAVGLVFLVACTNVGNLLLARAAHRSREVAIRSAMGASRIAIARQFLVEALVLSIGSAALGAVIAQAGIAAFRAALANTGEQSFWADVSMHPQVFLFIALAAVAASLASGVLPAITASRSDITDVLKDQSLGSSSLRSGRLSRSLVVFELTLSSALLVVAALTVKSIQNLRSVEPRFRTHDVLTGRVTLTLRDTARQAEFFARLEADVARIPGAAATSLSTNLPGTGWSGGRVAVFGRTYRRAFDRPMVRLLSVTPGFFKTFEVAVVRGRAITDQDRAAALPVAVVNQRFADENFRNADPIGQRISLNAGDTAATWLTIVGVVPTLYSAGLGDPWPAEVLTAFHQESHTSASVAIRTSADPSLVTPPLRAVVASLDRDLPVYAVTMMDRALAQLMWPMRIFGGLFIVFGVVALALGSIGLYAVLAFTVSRREREMGIRMALGAAAVDVVRLVVRGAAGQLALGVSLGVLLGILGAQAGRAALYGVRPTDPATIAVVIATLAVTGFAACIVPAMRATRSDPVRSLRAE